MTETVRTSAITSVIRNLWNINRLDKSDPRDSNTEEDEDVFAGREQLSINLTKTLRTKQLLLNFHNGKPVLSLKPPLDLVNFPTIPRPRWPLECEVISDVIQHIEWEPPEPEPFYQPSGHEGTPVPVGEERREVVYCSDPATKHPYFTCSRVGGSKGPMKMAPSHVSHSDFTLEFESRYESGNLQKAMQVGIFDYELTLRTDMYTTKHSQWFYFRVRNMKAGATYRFTIINLTKSSSLYSQGMRPLLYSERAATENSVGWQRTGSNIKYYRNACQSTKDNNESVTLYSLTWTLQFPYDSDTCYLAHCYPYTYSHLQRYLRRISSNPALMSFCKVRVLCQSLAGNAVYVVTVTSRGASRVEVRNKKAVVVTARVHPGETNGSWVMEGFLDFLLGDSDDAQVLRDNFIFKVVPMLNPDGVVVGNYRCSLAGRDLNRNYKTLLKDSFPCVWHTCNMVERLMAETEVVLYCDFHGHNRKNNVFMYGCNSRDDAPLKLQERVFPLMMSKNASNKFSFRSCKFRVQRSKEGTARIVMWRLGIRNSYTMEASFGGSTLDDRRGTHFTTRDLKSLGFHFCDTLLDFCDPDQTKVTYCLKELAALLGKKVKERIGKDLGTDRIISVSDLETSTSGSNSSDSDGLPVHLQNQPENPEKSVKKKKRLKTHKERNRLQRDRVGNDPQLKVLQSSSRNLESKLIGDDSDKESSQNKPVEGERKKRQLNSLTRKAGSSPPSESPGEPSQVTPWQRCKPIKENCPENPSTSCLQRKTAPPRLSSTNPAAPHSGDEMKERRRWRCSSQLLHLRVLFPPPTDLIRSTRKPYSPQQWASYCQVCRGLPPPVTAPHRSSPSVYASLIPAIVPSKHLPTTFTSFKSSSRHGFRQSYSLRASGNYLLQDSSMSNTDLTKTKQQNRDQDSSEGFQRNPDRV
ncbi:cytosolic carboxypeptidase 2 isoform X2 [Kryptolebias marmoratus]|uniref:cytosolic carboxypeptidase 2 isoform X2 n=1 Tax=Kryptolebias marmoratus TaxID=37003 RepID=UPI000D530CE7|nr:cytosolic carboxypeptidase 2 isoform X2 [Kryptolebias marmoratus]